MVDLFEQELSKLNFPNYQNYNDINVAYNGFIKLATTKERGVNKTLRNGLMEKLPIDLKIMIDYFQNLKIQNYTLTKIFIMPQDINYRQ